MFPQIQTTPIAGARLTSHIRALLLMFATYLPPPTSLSAAISVPTANRSTRVPQEVLTAVVVEEIKTRCCFVGGVLGAAQEPRREDTPTEDEGYEMDIPHSDISMTGSEVSHAGSSQQDSEFSVVVDPHTCSAGNAPGESHLQALSSMYKRYSTATDIHMRVTPPPSQPAGTGKGTLVIPGWIRERATELLFEGGDVDESSLAETVLDALLKVILNAQPHFHTYSKSTGSTRPS
jgi:actin-related protein 10